MALVIADRVKESSTTTGTGSILLAGAATSFRTFDNVLDTADTTYYAVVEQSGSNWEVGIGTFTSPATLARTTILSSSNNNLIVNFTAGGKDVFIDMPAAKIVSIAYLPVTLNSGSITNVSVVNGFLPVLLHDGITTVNVTLS